MPQKTTPTKKEAFLAAFAVNGTISKAAEAAEMERSSHYRWLAEDREYAAAFEDAKEQFVERLETEAVRRATEGVSEDVYHQGKVVGQKLRYSDLLMIFLLKAAAPQKYKDRWELSADASLTAVPAQIMDEVMARARELKAQRGLPPAENGLASD